ncbi:MAG TPA: HypC/HybG/HupF family hydrogenase formation chaperone [Anaerolineaceae bacterium]|nr:HypC/HybG/HupF family hydrogenase formation chaperone [Anaerolineaceae bacterium]
MCLGVPGKITEIYEQNGLLMGKIDFGGVLREACLSAIPDAQVGEYTLVHAGFALNRISEEEAQITLETLREIIDLNEELSPEDE